MKEKLSNAVLSGNLLFLKEYVNQGGHFNDVTLLTPEGYGNKPLELAAHAQIDYKGSAEITKLLIDNSSKEKQAEALISFASEDRDLEYAKVLLENGIFVDLVEKNGTALQRAVGNGNLKMVHLLLKYGADPTLEGEYGTALEGAERKSYEPAFEGMMQSFMKGEEKSPYDFVDKEKIKEKLITWYISLEALGTENKDQTFYILALDASRLKANSEEAFQATLARYQKDYAEYYSKEEDIQKLKYSSGDFSFYDIEKKLEKDFESYTVDIDFSFLEPRVDENRTKNELLIEGLVKNKTAFTKTLNISADFKIEGQEHIY